MVVMATIKTRLVKVPRRGWIDSKSAASGIGASQSTTRASSWQDYQKRISRFFPCPSSPPFPFIHFYIGVCATSTLLRHSPISLSLQPPTSVSLAGIHDRNPSLDLKKFHPLADRLLPLLHTPTYPPRHTPTTRSLPLSFSSFSFFSSL